MYPEINILFSLDVASFAVNSCKSMFGIPVCGIAVFQSGDSTLGFLPCVTILSQSSTARDARSILNKSFWHHSYLLLLRYPAFYCFRQRLAS
mmetsp:Transcript_6167/g.13388  ORF Transcript_6167/g.13388 Transcript_6167/m.13388 type:complete len:92 (-) Transcript_6167:134-409(-)